ncbi:MAG: homoserine kinase [Alphaproteobacteria bacterium]|jgi:homoserine kinase type II|nr:homoserine kinase [Alphaproteobacteria bacterium]
MAVYTEVSDSQLAAFMDQYDLGDPLGLMPIAEGVENSNYRLATSTGTYILTIYEKRVDREDLPFFLGLMEHLSAGGIPCPLPIQGRDGEALRELSGKAAAIITFLDGAWPRKIKPVHCRGLGAAMAQMHLAGADFALSRPNSLSMTGWREVFQTVQSRADEVAPGLAAEIARELDFIEANWPKDLPAGVIHADLFPDNVFFKGDGLSGIIDFYFACNDFFAYDLAICLNAWCFEPDRSFNVTKAKLMLSSYRKVRPFSETEVANLPLLARGAALRFLLTRLHDWLHQVDGALVKPKDPAEYLQKLRFHRDVTGPADYGLD